MSDVDAKPADDEFLPDEPDEPVVFEREDGEEQGDKAGILCVTESARRHWSDKNPKKFTPETALKIIQYLGAGCFIETAAAAAGINKTTLYDWMKKAERSEEAGSTEELRAWKAQLDEAEANAEARAIMGIQEAGAQGVWQAFAWFLERKYSQRWGRKDTTLLGNPDGSPLTPQQINFVGVDPRDAGDGSDGKT